METNSFVKTHTMLIQGDAKEMRVTHPSSTERSCGTQIKVYILHEEVDFHMILCPIHSTYSLSTSRYLHRGRRALAMWRRGGGRGGGECAPPWWSPASPVGAVADKDEVSNAIRADRWTLIYSQESLTGWVRVLGPRRLGWGVPKSATKSSSLISI